MRNLLVIDDDYVICDVLKRIFKSEKYLVRTGHTADEGRSLCIKEPPDLVLLDINLPDGSGLDLCRKLKEDPRLKHIPVLILTGGTSEEDGREAGLEAGAEDYSAKPFIVEEIVAQVAGLIDRGVSRGGALRA